MIKRIKEKNRFVLFCYFAGFIFAANSLYHYFSGNSALFVSQGNMILYFVITSIIVHKSVYTDAIIDTKIKECETKAKLYLYDYVSVYNKNFENISETTQLLALKIMIDDKRRRRYERLKLKRNKKTQVDVKIAEELNDLLCNLNEKKSLYKKYNKEIFRIEIFMSAWGILQNTYGSYLF